MENLDQLAGQRVLRGTNVASIDIGSHTARMLIGRYTGQKDLFRAITRRRSYIKLAEGFDAQTESSISKEALKRTINALKGFSSTAMEHGVAHIRAVSTGIVRKAVNKNHFIDSIYRNTGIGVKIVSGLQEALLTRLGALHYLGVSKKDSMIFDLGGGTTEFIKVSNSDEIIRSLPIGALVMTMTFFSSDPPAKDEMKSLSNYVLETLEEALSRENYAKDNSLIGTGGTVTTLASMINNIKMENITPSRINGLIIKRAGIEGLLNRIKGMPFEERLKLKGIDQGRAGVILAGAFAVSGILNYFNSDEITVSYSDILEGIIIDNVHQDILERK
jgi:exopolyphosphatase/guanosine-5'-triphosphate,3'-diphosphate pyrophosphatase